MKDLRTSPSPEEWLTLRSKCITSTESSALFHSSPYSTEYELWHRKKNKELGVIEKTERMLWGNRLEHPIGLGIAEDNGWKATHLEKCFLEHPEYNRMGSSFDFLVECKERGKGILEIKNVDYIQHRDDWVSTSNNKEGKAPLHIEFQLQHQLEVARLEWGCIAVLIGGNKVETLYRKRNPKVGDALLKKTQQFWKSIDDDKAPSPNFRKDADFIISLFSSSQEGKILDLSDSEEIKTLCTQYQQHSEKEKEYGVLKKATKAQIMMVVGDAEKALCDDFSINLKSVKEKSVPSYIRKEYRSFRIIKKETMV